MTYGTFLEPCNKARPLARNDMLLLVSSHATKSAAISKNVWNDIKKVIKLTNNIRE
ncbi:MULTISPECIES: hypothetical protein [unclassified Rickettsia]|uniref:hypothetical protein n=1 Tax=unclassified Rickettsia TaxID=114295 RepID=UPI00313313E8